MDTTKLMSVFKTLPRGQNWRLSVMSIRGGVNSAPAFMSRLINLDPESAMMDYLKEITSHYIDKKHGWLLPFPEIAPYQGEWSSERIFHLRTDDEKVRETVDLCKNADRGMAFLGNPAEIDVNAFLLHGVIPVDEAPTDVWLLSTRKPFQRLSRRFSWKKGRKVYKRIDERILTLSVIFDAAIVGKDLFFLSIAGAQVFVCETICREIAKRKVEIVKNLTTNEARLKEVAQKGFNPRRFLSFDPKRVELLSDSPELAKKVSRLFDIEFDPQAGKFSLRSDEDANRLIKVVCNRGMEDPFTENAVEVAWSAPWAKNGVTK